MDAVVPIDQLAYILSRIQFGLTVGVHFLFPVTTLGLTFFILIAESIYVRNGDDRYRQISTIGIKFLGMVFAMGVATGIILPFAFGTNWAGFVLFAGGIFGVHLTLEAVLAFMLESVFLAVLLFGRERVSRRIYLLSAFFVFLGSHLSGFFIISANSWMQTPFHSLETLASGIPVAAIDGFHLEQVIDGTSRVITSAAQIASGVERTVVLDSVWKIIFNPSAVIRFVHTIFACWLTGASIFAAIAAGLFLKGRNPEVARTTFRLAVVVGLITSLSMPLLGHAHIMRTLKWQPTKDAAMEGIFSTQNGAPLYALGWVDPETRTTHALGLPWGLSFLETGRFDSPVEGLDDIVAEGQAHMAEDGTDRYKAYAPPVQTTFQAFHLMVFIGIVLIGMFGAGAWVVSRRKWEIDGWIWKLFIIVLPFPYIATEAGWIGAEIGRQPWVVYGLLLTRHGMSPIPAAYVLFSLIVFCLVYISLFFILAKWIPSMIKESLE